MNPAPGIPATFTTTHWSVVLAAGQRHSEQADEALETLCRSYWYPIYVFLRRSGWPPHDAEDLTQAFFERVLEKDYLRAVDRSKGKFRSFLLAMLRHFMANYRRDARTIKRGGQYNLISLDDVSLEEQYARSGFADTTPERSFERQWALTLLDQVVQRLRHEFRAVEKESLFDELKVFLTGDRTEIRYADLAAKLDTTEAALKMTVSRMRQRYGQLLRAEIAKTVSGPGEVEEELKALFAALS